MSKANPGAKGGMLTRRQVLKSAAAGAGLGVGSGLIGGFPTVWAQNVKDVTLVHMAGPTRRSRRSASRPARTSASRS